jgi:predicted AlkP superfamily phosphohydrolase/phosphomutase
VRNIPPDLIVYFGNLDWRSVGTVGTGSTWTSENDTGPDDANHAQHGIFILHDPANPRLGAHLGDVSIYDVAPTILTMLESSLEDGIRGTPLDLRSNAPYSEDEEEIISQRLRDLGYL